MRSRCTRIDEWRFEWEPASPSPTKPARTRRPSLDRLFVALRAAAVCMAAVEAGCGSQSAEDPTPVGSLAENAVRVPQTPLDGATIPKYVDPLPTLSNGRVNGTATVSVDMREFQQRVLPGSVYSGLPAPFRAGTFLWGYKVNNSGPSWPSATIESQRNAATSVIYSNSLRGGNGAQPVLQRYLTQDLTLHWAD